MPNQLAAPTVTLRTVTSAGALNQFLPDYTELSLSPVFCQPGAVTFKYPANGRNFALLKEDLEFAVLLNGVEIPGLRSIIEAVDGNDTDEAEDGASWSYTARTTQALLDRGVVYPKNWPVTTPPNYDFVDKTAGYILIQLIQACQARGALTGLTWDFSTTLDSAGQAWSTGIDIAFDAGIKISEVVANLVDQGLIEVRMSRRVLQMYNAGTLGVDRTTGPTPLRFLAGRDIKESPRKISTRDLSTSVLVAGDDGLYSSRNSDTTTMTQWGRREGYYSASGVKVVGALNVIGDNYLKTINRPIQEVTHSLFFDTEINPRPITNFDVGDWALSDVGRGLERFRIKQWVIAVDNSDEVSGTVTLNDLIAEQIDRLNLALKNITNGSTAAGGSEEKDDGKAPAQPQSVSVSSDFYMQGDQPRALVTMQWAGVTTNEDGSALNDLAGYQAHWRYQGESAWRQTQTLDTNQTVTYFENVDTGRVVNTQVRAFDKYNRYGAWQDGPPTTTVIDTVAPPKPSPPIVASNVGTLRVVWNGKDVNGLKMPADFAGVEVHVGPNGTFTPTDATQVDFLTASAPTATTITLGLTYGTEYWIRLVAVDTTGNKSAPSDETTTSHAILSQVVGTEIGTGQVGLSNTRFSDIGNLVDDGNLEIPEVRVARLAQMAGTTLSFDNTTASNGVWSIKIVGQSPWTTRTLVMQSKLPVKPGERIFGAMDFKADSAVVPTDSTISLVTVWYDKNNAVIDPATPPTGATDDDYSVLATTYNRVTPNNTWMTRQTVGSAVAPANAVAFDVVLRCMTHFAGTIWVDSIEVRRQVDTLLIGDAAITNAKIANLAVNDAKIANASIGKLITGTLNADMIVGARIKTADTGARAEMNSGGFGAWNSSGTQTFSVAGANGAVSMIGQLRSGVTGKRVDINPGNTGLPEIRFYPTSGSNFGFLNAVGDGSDVSVGLNSGTYTESETGYTVANRLYMGNGFIHLEVIKAATQDQYGGTLQLDANSATIGRIKGGLNDNRLDFTDNGKMYHVGEVDYYGNNQNALMMGQRDWTGGPFGGADVTYGATQTTAPRGVAILNDTVALGDGRACSAFNYTTAGFSCAFGNGGSSGDAGSICWWAWRS